VNDAVLVSGFERVGDLTRERECLLQRNPPPGNTVRQRLAVHELQREGVGSGVFLETVDRSNVRMVERRQCARFPSEAGQAVGFGGQNLWQDLQSDIPLKLRVTCSVDLAHPAGADH